MCKVCLRQNQSPLAAVSINVAKDIPKGAELLFDYGDAYWDDRYPKWSPTRWMIDLL